ncbi:hypothetical protein [Clostridium arbusti]|uniref:hypothetical protein n=1 Tax=Clostridium arbusti TaxID=1137848 RepID=UPI000287D6B6|nr:hypothetical protein [Clostridium arbusti]
MKKLFIRPVQDESEKSNKNTKKLIGIIDKSDENYIVQGITNMLHKMNDTFYIITKRSEYYLYGYDSDNSGVRIILNHDFSGIENKSLDSNIEMHVSPSAKNENDLVISVETDNPEHSNDIDAFKTFCLQKLFIYED